MIGKHDFHPSILREYDVRGIVGETLGTADAYAIGKAFGTIIRRCGGNRMCVGYDGRTASPILESSLVEGASAAGVRTERIGLGPTPMLYFASTLRQTDGAIMVTGSHNPPKYNGFKFVLGNKPFFGDDIRYLGEVAAAADFEEGCGEVNKVEVFSDYINRILRDGSSSSNLHVVWDPGNGAAGNVIKSLVKNLPGRHLIINGEVNGEFPSHHPDPTVPENLVQIQNRVVEVGADLGLAFDGDGDRLGVVDGKGRIIWGDQLMVFFAEDVLRSFPGSSIIADVKSSDVFFKEVKRLGGNPVMGRTGHSFMKKHMLEIGAPLAGEMSGHIFFADQYYGFDDAIYAAVRLLRFLDQGSERSLAERLDALPKMVSTHELRFDCPEERKFKVIEEIKRQLLDEGVQVMGVDGIRVQEHGGWWLLRASNTQAALVARCEAKSDNSLRLLRTRLSDALKSTGIEISI